MRPGPAGGDRSPDFRDRSFLLLEDEVMIALELRFQLEERGAAVAYARTCREALALLSEGRRFDGAVLDVNLGGETCEPVARRLAVRRVPFVLHTGDFRAHGELVERLGAPVVAKPALDGAVAETLARALA